jgi:glycosyltransferase involved in cell wall biosynthesis
MINARVPVKRNEYHEIQGIPVHEVTYLPRVLKHPILQAFDSRVYRAVVAELKRVRPDLVHVHNVSGATLAPFVACRRLGVPLLLTLHDYWLLCPNNMLYKGDGLLCALTQDHRKCRQCFRRHDFWANLSWRRKIFARLVQNVRLFISPSQRLVDLHVVGGYDPARFRVVPYGISPTIFRSPSDPLVRQYVRERSLFRTLLFAGVIAESKGIQTIIEALPSLSRHIDGFRLLVAGRGDKRLVAALRRSDPASVKLLGRVPFQEMPLLYAAADLTVVPSVWYDNSPMVIYESLQAGTPVLGSDIGGIPELIRPGQTGYIFPPGDVGAFTEGVIQHFGLPAPERRAMRKRCIEYARIHMTMDRHLDGLHQAYSEALGQDIR